MSARFSLLPMLVMTVAFGAGCHREPQSVEKTQLVRLPTTYLPRTLVVSEDGKAYAFLIQTVDGERVVSSKGTSDVHVKCSKLAFAPKSDRLFYWTHDGPKEQPIIAIFANGTSIATDFVTPGDVVFSEDGSRWLAASAVPGPGKDELGDIALFVDGVRVARLPDLSLPTFSSDAQHLAYLTPTEGRVGLFVDGSVRQTFEAPTATCGAAAVQAAPRLDLPFRHSVEFLSDGTLLVATRDADGWGVYLNGRRIASYSISTLDKTDEDCAKTAVLALRSMRTAEQAPVAFWWERVAGDAEIWRVVRNGKPVDDVTCIEPWRRHPPEPSADGNHLVYACRMKKRDSDNTEAFLVKDGVRYGPYDDIWGIAPSKNGAHVAYGAASGSGERPWGIYVDGKLRASSFLSVWRPLVSEDGEALAWEAMLDDGGGAGIFGIGDRRLGSFDDIIWGPTFEPEDRVAWIIRRGRTVARVSVPLALARTSRRDAAAH